MKPTHTTLLLLLFLSGSASVAEEPVPRACFFAEPFSGNKVHQYDITLPVSPDQSKTLTIPQQCGAALDQLHQGAPQWGNSVDRRLLQKIDNDCRYHAFLTRYAPASEDFIGDFDFRNATLQDLPITTDPTQGEPCRFRDGRIQGILTPAPHGLHCHPTPGGPGARLIGVDRADVNGDGIQDAVINVIPLDLGQKRIPIRVPVTRTDPQAPFTLVPGMQPMVGTP